MNEFINYLNSPLGNVLASAVVSVFVTLLTSGIKYLVDNKRSERKKLIEICQRYVEKSSDLHEKFRDRIYNSDGTNFANVRNKADANQFKKSVVDDVELYKLMAKFSIENDGINYVIKKYDRIENQECYSFVDNLKKEFLKIQSQL